jgi:alkylation response protein AidB-like acyl-CoA dehydrogenase
MQIRTKQRTDSLPAFERLRGEIEALAPTVAARAAEIETARRIPPDLISTLRAMGVYRIFAPRSHGGFEFDLPQALQILTALSRIDGSIGWNAMIGSGGAMFAPLLARDVYDDIYRAGPDLVFAGATQPAGAAEMIDGKWHVSGRWPFASGCESADWLMGLCIMKQDGKPLPGAAEGMPMIRGALLPASAWTIEDTWHVVGLRGTGSHHIVLDDVVVPEIYLIDIVGGAPCATGPLYHGVQQFVPLIHGAVQIGIAEGAVAELVALANTGRQQQRAAVPMQQSEIFQYELGRIEADLRAAKAAHAAQLASHWQHAIAGTLKTDALLIEGSQTATWIAATCIRVTDGCYALGGAGALYDTSPLQRRMRDMHTAAQHAVVHPRHYVSAGALLLGNAAQTTKIGG